MELTAEDALLVAFRVQLDDFSKSACSRTTSERSEACIDLLCWGSASPRRSPFAIPVGATPPFSETVAEPALDVMSCNGFDAVIERTFTGRVTVYFDNQGNPLRVQINVAMTGSVTNSVTGTSLPLRGHIHVVDDFRTGVVTFVSRVPGE